MLSVLTSVGVWLCTQVPNPTGDPKTDLPIYRRAAFNETGCVSGIAVSLQAGTKEGCSAGPRRWVAVHSPAVAHVRAPFCPLPSST